MWSQSTPDRQTVRRPCSPKPSLPDRVRSTSVVTMPSETGFAEAVHAGVEAAPDSDWLWFLHDDCAPEVDALGVLLRAAEDQASVAVWGPKVLGWDEPRRLLEIGVSISQSGRRYTGLESGEQDQGQYDGQRDVLAVGSAGLLSLREVWSDLGGFERSLHFFREDVDFGWRVNLAGHRVVVATDAVVHHAESMARGRRTVQSASGSSGSGGFDRCTVLVRPRQRSVHVACERAVIDLVAALALAAAADAAASARLRPRQGAA